MLWCIRFVPPNAKVCMKKTPILVLRREASQLSPEELAALQSAFPGEVLEFIRIDPANHTEHASMCSQYGVTHERGCVYLPELPIPSTAMKQGVRHITATPSGVKELVSVNPIFKDL